MARKKTEKIENYYNVTAVGDYFVQGSSGNILRAFGPVTLKLDRWEAAQSMLRFHILPKLIQKADYMFKEIRKCVVVAITTADGKFVPNIPINLMSREQIIDFAESRNIPLYADMYPDIVELRQKLKMAMNNGAKFREEERKCQESYEKITKALSLNEDVFEEMSKNVKESNKKNNLVPESNTFTPDEEINLDG